MSVRSAVISAFQQVAKEQGKSLSPIKDNLLLLECGLDSLGLAIVVSRLEDALGVDPFSSSGEPVVPETMGDFVKLYEDAAG